MPHNAGIERWRSAALGRSNTVAFGSTVWAVSNARDLTLGFEGQVKETLAILDSFLTQAGTDRTRLLTVQVILANISDRDSFNDIWCQWVGENPEHWPQRAVFGASLAPGLLIEVIAVAARLPTGTQSAV